MSLVSLIRYFFRPHESFSDQVKLCVIGLGNPGVKYDHTRHNAGFRTLDYLHSSLTEIRRRTTIAASIVYGKLDDITLMTVKPCTFMNRSGDAVAELAELSGDSSIKRIVVVDDFNLPLGTIRIRRNGSHGGHNGLKSIIQAIGPEFPRLRIGIGPLPKHVSVIDFVLGNFTPAEDKVLSSVFPVARDAFKDFQCASIDTVMNKYNNNPAQS